MCILPVVNNLTIYDIIELWHLYFSETAPRNFEWRTHGSGWPRKDHHLNAFLLGSVAMHQSKGF